MFLRGSLAPLAHPVDGRPSRALVVRGSRSVHGKRHPAAMGAREVTKSLASLAADEGVAASTRDQALSALLFLSKDVLEMDLPWLDGIVRPRRPAPPRNFSGTGT